MQSLSLIEAATFVKLHPEELRRRAKRGLAPGAKVGKCWVFLEPDLADYVRSFYAFPRQALRVASGKEATQCHYANAGQSGGSISALPTESEYANLLGLAVKPSRKSSTTS